MRLNRAYHYATISLGTRALGIANENANHLQFGHSGRLQNATHWQTDPLEMQKKRHSLAIWTLWTSPKRNPLAIRALGVANKNSTHLHSGHSGCLQNATFWQTGPLELQKKTPLTGNLIPDLNPKRHSLAIWTLWTSPKRHPLAMRALGVANEDATHWQSGHSGCFQNATH